MNVTSVKLPSQSKLLEMKPRAAERVGKEKKLAKVNNPGRNKSIRRAYAWHSHGGAAPQLLTEEPTEVVPGEIKVTANFVHKQDGFRGRGIYGIEALV